MVLLDNKKFACQTCIKGHRSSGCMHTDRPLFEIKKKGRPVTQCDHCRELRKTKQVHIKCSCDSRDDAQARAIGPVAPAFPNGLMRADASSSAMELPQLPPIQSSNHLPSCNCGAEDGECKCWMPRKRTHKPRTSTSSSISTVSSSASFPVTPIHDPPTSFIDHTNAMMSQKTPTAADFPHMHSRNASLNSTTSHMDYEYHAIASPSPQHTLNHPMQVSAGSPPYSRPEPQQSSEAQFEGGAYTSNPTQQMAEADANASEFYFPWPTTPSGYPPSGSSCRCGQGCSCPGCSEHANYDGTMAPSVYCTAGCSAGLPCANSIHNPPPPPQQQSSAQPPISDISSFEQQQSLVPNFRNEDANSSAFPMTSLDLTYQNLINSTPTPPTPPSNLPLPTASSTIQDPSTPLIHQSPWNATPPSPEPHSRRTGFATSGERRSCCSSSESLITPGTNVTIETPSHSISEYPSYAQDSTFPSQQEQPTPLYEENNTNPSNPTSYANLPGLRTPISSSIGRPPPSLSIPHQPTHSRSPPLTHRSHSHTTKPGISKRSRSSNVSGGGGVSVSGNGGSSVTNSPTRFFKGSIKRLLPRPASAAVPVSTSSVSGAGDHPYTNGNGGGLFVLPPPDSVTTDYYQGGIRDLGPLATPFNRYM